MVGEVPRQEDAALGFYEADVNEAAMSSLSTLRKVRGLLAVAGLGAAVRIVDQCAADLAADALGEDEEEIE